MTTCNISSYTGLRVIYELQRVGQLSEFTELSLSSPKSSVRLVRLCGCAANAVGGVAPASLFKILRTNVKRKPHAHDQCSQSGLMKLPPLFLSDLLICNTPFFNSRFSHFRVGLPCRSSIFCLHKHILERQHCFYRSSCLRSMRYL